MPYDEFRRAPPLEHCSSIFSERYAPFFQNGIKPHKIIRFENVAVQ
jgi:hypothetical protein